MAHSIPCQEKIRFSLWMRKRVGLETYVRLCASVSQQGKAERYMRMLLRLPCSLGHYVVYNLADTRV
jgi:hypothetical protein